MAANNLPNYPDILGYISGQERSTINNIVDVAVAVRPTQVLNGQPFAVIALVQNVTDVGVQVVAVLNLPAKDKAKQDNPFYTEKSALEIVLAPAEVGYIVFPVNCSTVTAPGVDYRVRVEFYAKASIRPRRVRHNADDDPEATLNYYFYLSEDALRRIAKLRELDFTAAKGGLFGGSTLEARFDVLSGGKWQATRKTPNWISLWNLAEHSDTRALLERHHELLSRTTLPALKQADLYEPLLLMTRQRFSNAGYDMVEAEAHLIVKVMMLLLETAQNTTFDPNHPYEDRYRLAARLKLGWQTDGKPVPLPNWCRAIMSRFGVEQDIETNPLNALLGPLYNELILDTVEFAFAMLKEERNINFGSESEVNHYGVQIVDALWDPAAQLSIVEIYLPMIMAGILVDERVLIRHENKLENIHTALNVMNEHKAFNDPDFNVVIEMVEDISHTMLKKYGYRLGRY